MIMIIDTAKQKAWGGNMPLQCQYVGLIEVTLTVDKDDAVKICSRLVKPLPWFIKLNTLLIIAKP